MDLKRNFEGFVGPRQGQSLNAKIEFGPIAFYSAEQAIGLVELLSSPGSKARQLE